MIRAMPRALPVLACALLACASPSKSTFQLGLPGSAVDLDVAAAEQRYGYLDTTLAGEGWTLRTFLPASERCRRVVADGAKVQFKSSGPYGTIVRGAEQCEASGIGSLGEWRAKRGRSLSRSIIPSGLATYRKVWSDEEWVFLRGNFPLTGHLGFAGMGDAIAVVANVPICQRAIARESSTVEYFPAGRNVLTLSAAEGRCQIEGLIRPLAAADLES